MYAKKYKEPTKKLLTMFEFNPDGSVKLPGSMAKEKGMQDKRMQSQKCIKVRKDIVSTYSPKSCKLTITLSNAISNNYFIENIHGYFRKGAEVMTKLNKISEKEFEIIVGTCFRRCSDCSSLVSKYRDFLDGNLIEDKGTCTYKGRNSNFCDEDYFD